jgi:transcriptional regulator with XRE-family HTH domain
MIKAFLDKLKEKGWKQKDIAIKTGISHGYISRLERGNSCSAEILIIFADTFNVSVDEILGRKESKILTKEEIMLLDMTDGDSDITRAALRCVQGEKLIKESMRGGERGKEKAA